MEGVIVITLDTLTFNDSVAGIEKIIANKKAFLDLSYL